MYPDVEIELRGQVANLYLNVDRTPRPELSTYRPFESKRAELAEIDNFLRTWRPLQDHLRRVARPEEGRADAEPAHPDLGSTLHRNILGNNITLKASGTTIIYIMYL